MEAMTDTYAQMLNEVFGPASPNVPAVKSDGGATSYYELPLGASELGDLIEAKAMSFNRGNVFKAAYRLGEKDGATTLYDLRKMRWFVDRMIACAEKGLPV